MEGMTTARPPRVLPPLLRPFDPALPERLFAAAHARLLRVGPAATYWRTFWYPLGSPATNVVEALIPSLQTHLPASTHRVIGVEWWIGRMHTTRVPLDFHHDRDLQLFERTGRLRHPIWSSVLFFNRVRGGSLLVTDQRLVRRGGALVLRPAEAGQFASIRPARNRFVVFPGDCFHGVLDANDAVPSGRMPGPPGRPRLTLIVNWWDRPPAGVRSWAESRAYRALGFARRPPKRTG